jgi:hypothetical protein
MSDDRQALLRDLEDEAKHREAYGDYYERNVAAPLLRRAIAALIVERCPVPCCGRDMVPQIPRGDY